MPGGEGLEASRSGRKTRRRDGPEAGYFAHFAKKRKNALKSVSKHLEMY
jgi:hypothetical protein